MRSRDLSNWMWSEALSVLDRAERLQRQFFTQVAPAWEPPVDVVESDDTLHVQVALPGVHAEAITLAFDPAGVSISALRPFPGAGAQGRIHRIEIPHGRFERYIGLPLEQLEPAGRALENGVLTLTFRRKAT